MSKNSDVSFLAVLLVVVVWGHLSLELFLTVLLISLSFELIFVDFVTCGLGKSVPMILYVVLGCSLIEASDAARLPLNVVVVNVVVVVASAVADAVVVVVVVVAVAAVAAAVVVIVVTLLLLKGSADVVLSRLASVKIIYS